MASEILKSERRKKSRRDSGRSGRAAAGSPRDNGRDGRKQKSRFREWLDALVFAAVVMLIVRTLIFDLFRIPTPSMEKNLLVGDYLFVSKLHYGTRTPMTLGIPFTQTYLPGVSLPHTRLPGFTEIKRGDAIVFNWPDDRQHPVDRKTHYIKRVMGLPGETIALVDKVVHVNGDPISLASGMQQWWNVYKTDPRVRLSQSALTELGIDPETQVRYTSDQLLVQIVATPAAIKEIGAWPWVQRVEPYISPPSSELSKRLYPEGNSFTTDNYGPIVIPGKDVPYELSDENWAYFAPAIKRYEGHEAARGQDGEFLIDGQPVTSYTFRQDYFFVMGDYRDNSEDSRFWGYVPMDHVVGKAVMVYFSWDSSEKLPRFGRIFSLIDEKYD